MCAQLRCPNRRTRLGSSGRAGGATINGWELVMTKCRCAQTCVRWGRRGGHGWREKIVGLGHSRRNTSSLVLGEPRQYGAIMLRGKPRRKSSYVGLRVSSGGAAGWYLLRVAGCVGCIYIRWPMCVSTSHNSNRGTQARIRGCVKKRAPGLGCICSLKHAAASTLRQTGTTGGNLVRVLRQRIWAMSWRDCYGVAHVRIDYIYIDGLTLCGIFT